jgi:gliding motility-associated-like protein
MELPIPKLDPKELPPPITLTPPANLTFNEPCGGSTNDQTSLQNWINNQGGIIATGNCVPAFLPEYIGFSWTTSSGIIGTGLPSLGPFPLVVPNNCQWWVDVNFKYKEICNSRDSLTLRFVITDNQPPNLLGIPGNITVNCPAIPPVPNIGTTISANDNCTTPANITINFNTFNIAGPCQGNYQLVRNWTATDQCGNSTSRSQVIIVTDNSPPILVGIPNDITVDCTAPAPPPIGITGVRAIDDCDQSVFVELLSSVSTQNPSPSDCGFYNYTLTRTWRAIDFCNKVTTASQVITVQDIQAPNFTLPPNVTVECNNAFNLAIIGQASGLQDNCTINPNLTATTNIIGSTTGCSYIVERVFTASDICNNVLQKTQVITVEDINPPFFNTRPDSVFRISCQSPIPTTPVIGIGITALDNCDNNVSISFNQTTTRSLNPTDCSFTNYIITRNWTAEDNCGKTAVFTQRIIVLDSIRPVLEVPALQSFGIDPGVCSKTFPIPFPTTLFDECSTPSQSWSLNVGPVLITNPVGFPPLTTPVDSVILDFPSGATNVPPQSFSSPVTLTINLNNLDAEASTERFSIRNEDGLEIGQTNLVPTQCSNGQTTISVSNIQGLNRWAQDGNIRFVLKPIGTGGFAINNICTGGNVTASISGMSTTNLGNLKLDVKVDNGPFNNFSPNQNITLFTGVHTIIYRAEDCSGNTALDTLFVRITDTDPPIISCPPSQVYYLGTAKCDSLINLNFPQTITDNCGFPGSYSANLTKFFKFGNDPNAGIIPVPLVISFDNTPTNVVGDAALTLRLRADVGDLGEFFTLLGEDGVSLGNTNLGNSNTNCNDFLVTSFGIPRNKLASWASDGKIELTLVANNDVINYSDFVSPCSFVNPDSTDFVSRVVMDINYPVATPTYILRRQVTLDTVSRGSLNQANNFLRIGLGRYETIYKVSDAGGSTGSCSFNIEVLDTIRPSAICKSQYIVRVPPTGLSSIMQATEIDDGSFDNCTISSITAFPNTFSCTASGVTFPVTLTVTDNSGLSSTCISEVLVEPQAPRPNFNNSICGGDTLYLFANAPSGLYNYFWQGPQNFFSTDQNPKIPSVNNQNSGTYTCRITGITGCTALGSVSVSISNFLPTPTIQSNTNVVCNNQTFTLTTTSFSGSSVTYKWYEQLSSGVTLLVSTNTPSLSINGISPGPHEYFVQVNVSTCVSNPSSLITINGVTIPTAITNDPNLNKCEEEIFQLGTPLNDPGLTYNWTGPNNYTSSNRLPQALTASASTTGTYSLIVSRLGCSSLPANTVVAVRPRPQKPLISVSGPLCEGDDLRFTASTNQADSYNWIRPNLSTIQTTANSLLVAGANSSNSGNWRVNASLQGCVSENSDQALAIVEARPTINILNSGPVCKDSIISLSANQVQGATYEWKSPLNQVVGNTPAISIRPIPGSYSLVVRTNFGCIVNSSTTVVVNDPPGITALAFTGDICSRPGQIVQLVPTIFPIGATYTYLWEGPNGFRSTANEPILPNGNDKDNGVYILKVKDTNGCESLPNSLTVNLRAAPETPIITSLPSICEGQPLQISTTSYLGDSIFFYWQTPFGPDTTRQPFLDFNAATVSASGNYTVLVERDGCFSSLSNTFSVQVRPKPLAPQIIGTQIICSGDTIKLSILNPQLGVQYRWFGPNGFSSSVTSPRIVNSGIVNQGDYYAFAILSGCESENSIPFSVVVRPRPSAPTIFANSPFCIDAPNASLTINVTNPNSSSYSWYNASNNSILSGPLSTSFWVLNNFAGYNEGINSFYAIASNAGCTSEKSNTLNLVFNRIPSGGAFAGDDQQLCNRSSTLMTGLSPNIGTGSWTQTQGSLLNIVNSAQSNTAILGLMPGENYQFRWTLSNGACQNYAFDEVIISNFGTNELADAGDSISVCGQNTIRLNGNIPRQGTIGRWIQSSTQQALGIVLTNPSDPKCQVTGLVPGNVYFFRWTFSNPGCQDFTSDEVIVTVTKASDEKAFAGLDFDACGEGNVELKASRPIETSGLWSSLDPSISFSARSDPNSKVFGLKQGKNVLIWTLSNSNCGVFSKDSVILTFTSAPISNQDTYSLDYGKNLEFNPLENDTVSGPYSLSIVKDVSFGTLQFTNNGNFNFIPDPIRPNNENFIYKICLRACPDVCTESTVFLNLKDAPSCAIPNIITPNGDDVNDAFIVPCLSSGLYPENNFIVYNQWGDAVFTKAGYKNEWEGTFNGEPLPPGTYYYILKFTPNSEPETGFLIIER